MPEKLSASIAIQNFRVKIITNDSKVLKLLDEQLELARYRRIEKPAFEVLFNLERTDLYKIPRTKRDVFKQEPLFQDEHISDDSIIINVGFRTLQVDINPKEDYVHVYIAYGQDFIDRNLFFDLVFFQPLRFLLRFHKIYVLHSGCVVKDNSAVLLAGNPGSGKSIISLSLVRNGYKYLTDDDTFFWQKGDNIECFAFYSEPKIKNYLLRYFPEMKRKYLKPLKQDKKQKVEIKKLYPNCFQDKSSPKLLIFPEFSLHSKTRIEAIDKQYALRRLVEDKFRIFQGQYENISKLHFETLSKLVKQVKTYKLIYKDQDVDMIPELVSRLL
ncbi:MAG: hypothetical protein PHI86_04135 [Candidatus Omnitrophica bacterium]|nr:hypothetical protein [Candidatus Omnitrophota bacterium]HOX54894.1 hypothetical protein [Candidatus Omnitrophota bacterium]